MKKLISIVLVAVMLLSVLPLATFAKTLDAGEAAATAPALDGVVKENEYSWTSGQFDRNVAVDNEVYVVTPYNADNVYNGGNKVMYSQLWMSYDADYIYLAYRERGGYASKFWLDLNPCVGLAESKSQLSVYVNGSTFGLSTATEGADATADIQIFQYNSEGRTDGTVADYIGGATKLCYDDNAMIVSTYEIAVKRSGLAAYASNFNAGTTSFDTLGFRAFIQSDYTETGAEVFYADEASAYAPFATHTYRGYHIFDVTAASVPTPTPTTPTVDGTVTAGEYEITRTADIPDGASSWGNALDADGTIFGVDNPYGDGASKATFHYTVDGEYLYFAGVLETTGSALLSRFGVFDYDALSVDPDTGKKKIPNTTPDLNQINNNGSSQAGANITWDYAEKAAASTTNGDVNTYVYEGKVALTDIGSNLYTVVLNCRLYSGTGFIYYIEEISINATTPDPGPDPTPTYDPYDLGAYGQQKVTLAENKTANPNGTVEDGEYSWSYEAVIANDENDDKFYVVAPGTDPNAVSVTYYLAADDDNIYIASVHNDTSIVTWHDVLYANIYATSDLTKYAQIYLTDHGTVEYHQIASGKTLHSSLSCSKNENGATYEIAISKTALAECFEVDSVDEILLTLYDRVEAELDVDEYVVWGFMNDELTNAGLFAPDYNGAYPNVVVLPSAAGEPAPGPGTDTPVFDPSLIDLSTNVTTAPALDGVIGAGEYTYTYGADLPEGAANWAAYDDNGLLYAVDDPYTFGYRGVEWSFAADADYVYVALAINKVSNADPRAELMFFNSTDGIGIGGSSGNTAYAYNNIVEYNGSITTQASAIATLTADDVEVAEKTADNKYVYEFRFKRSELEAAGSELYFMGRTYAQDGQWGTFITFGDGLAPLTVKLATVDPDTHVCDTKNWLTSNALNHNGYCDVCGEPVSAFHVYGPERTLIEATCVEGGRIAKTCTVCKFTFNKATEVDSNAHDYVDGVCTRCDAVDPEADTTPVETEPTVTEPVVTDPVDTKPVETTPTETTPVETTPVVDENGCETSIAAVAVALVATLGTCVVFAGKKRD